jgi:DNA-binding transcriptional MerR regulator
MRIGELATKTGVSVRALRYYEEQDLLASDRSPGGQRHYQETAVDRIQLIQQLYAAGLTSKAIVELIPCVVDGNPTPELLERLSTERTRIDNQIANLTNARNRLDAVIAGASNHLLTGQPCRTKTTRQGRNGAVNMP